MVATLIVPWPTRPAPVTRTACRVAAWPPSYRAAPTTVRIVESRHTDLPAVLVDHVSKEFELPQEKVHTLKERVLHPLRRTGVDRLVALRDVSFAVGDASFQQKCFDVFHALRDQGKTILFVTHDMGSVKRFCNRAMLLEDGELKMVGEPEEVGEQYVEINFGRGDVAEGIMRGPG